MTTTVRQLIETLEQIAEQYGDETQVLAAHQPSYPLAECVSAVVVTKVDHGTIVDDEEDRDLCETPDCNEYGVVFSQETDKVYCPQHAEENGIDMMMDNAVPVMWFLLGGSPDSYGDSAWTSPYATRKLWDESVGESFAL